MATIKVTYSKLPVEGQLEDGVSLWHGHTFIVNNPDIKKCDFWFVLNDDELEGDNEAFCPKENVFLILGEPDNIKIYETSFVKQFENIVSIQDKIYPVKNTIRWYLAQWFVGYKFKGNTFDSIHHKTYAELINMSVMPKKKLLSVVSSNKNMCEGHRKRLEFVDCLKKYFGDTIDVYGRGIKPFEDKWDVLADYKYHIAIENCSKNDYITEKFLDPVLAFTYPIYYGAPNIQKYYNSQMFTPIDIDNPKCAVEKIRNVINSNTYELSLKVLMEERLKILDEYNIFNKMLEFTLNKKTISEGAVPAVIKLHKGYVSMTKNIIKKLLRCIPR